MNAATSFVSTISVITTALWPLVGLGGSVGSLEYGNTLTIFLIREMKFSIKLTNIVDGDVGSMSVGKEQDLGDVSTEGKSWDKGEGL